MRIKILILVVAVTLFAQPIFAQAGAGQQKFQPTVGQDGKDVIWVPTPDEMIAAMLDAAKVQPGDFLIDLGSGDGRIVIAAAKRGVKAMGVEFNPDMVELSTANAKEAGVSDKATFVRGDIFEVDFSQATVLTMYLLPDLNMRLRPKILEMKPGTRVVTHAFDMEDWEADQKLQAASRSGYLWLVPAKLEGSWTWATAAGEADLVLSQKFQKVEGRLKIGGRTLPVQNAILVGDRLSFSVPEGNPGTREYAGVVKGSTIEGTSRKQGDAGEKWTATRKPGVR
jgi:precorrin-6B methylase 2